MSLRDRARWYATLAEAAALLAVAGLLVRHVRFDRWRATLGHAVAAPRARRLRGPTGSEPRRIVRAIDRAGRLRRAGYACLPRAMALQWMLRRRGRPSTLVFGMAPGSATIGPRDLHAWVEIDGIVAIGGGTNHAPAFALAQA